MVFTFFKEWAFLGFKASSFTHRAPPKTVLKVSARVEKSVATTGETTNFQSSLGVLLLLRQSPPKKTRLSGEMISQTWHHIDAITDPQKHDSLYGAWRATH